MPHKTKQALRETLQQRYATHTLTDYTESAIDLICTQEVFLRASVVLAYEPLMDEIPCMHTLRKRYADKQWYVPEEATHSFVNVASRSDYWHPTNVPIVLIAPARALDAHGNRLGRGGGWYDTFLAKHPQIVTISVVPDFAFFDQIPRESHDISVHIPLVAHADRAR